MGRLCSWDYAWLQMPSELVLLVEGSEYLRGPLPQLLLWLWCRLCPLNQLGPNNLLPQHSAISLSRAEIPGQKSTVKLH